MTIFAWYDIPVALIAGLCVVLAGLHLKRERRKHARWMQVRTAASGRRVEDFYWSMYRNYEAAEAELLYVNRVIESYVNGTAEIDRPRELHSVPELPLERVI